MLFLAPAFLVFSKYSNGYGRSGSSNAPSGFPKLTQNTSKFMRMPDHVRVKAWDLGRYDGDLKNLAGKEVIAFLEDYADKRSPRKKYKSSGLLLGRNSEGHVIALVATNSVPKKLFDNGIRGEFHFTEGDKTHNATVHFEMHLLNAESEVGPLHDKIMVVTDPNCPNCSKYVAMSDVQAIVISDNAFHRPIYRERIAPKDSYRKLSLPILYGAGDSNFR